LINLELMKARTILARREMHGTNDQVVLRENQWKQDLLIFLPNHDSFECINFLNE